MRRFFPLTVFALASLALAAPMVAGAGEEPRSPYNLLFEGSLPDATILNVAVDAKGVKPIALSLVGGKVLNGVSIPGEGGRHVVVTAQNADGKVIYEGSLDIDVGKEFTPQVAVELKSAIDGTPGELTLASHRVALEFASVEREGKLLTRLTGNVFDANGLRLELKPDDLAWEIDDPQIRETLAPCPIISGAAPLCVEFRPIKPDGLQISVDACFRRGICEIVFVPPVTPVWGKVTVGLGGHACAIKLDGTAYCWGQGEHGQLGYTAPKDCSQSGLSGSAWACSLWALPVQCTWGPCLFTEISAGTRHTCAIDVNQDAWCWGDNYEGALGLGTFSNTSFGIATPHLVVDGHKWLAIRAGFGSTCGLTTNHEVMCWGNNKSSLVPQNPANWTNRPGLVAFPALVDEIDYTSSHACARVAGGDLFCWGSGSFHNLGNSTFTPTTTCINCPAVPVLMQNSVPGLLGKSANLVGAGVYGSCAHTTTNETVCWGQYTPALIAPMPLERLSFGFQHYCGLSNSSALCSGIGAMGDGGIDTSNGYGPVRPSAPLHFRDIDTGHGSTCAIGRNDRIYCWGANDFGTLGGGTPGVTSQLPLEVNIVQTFNPKPKPKPKP